MRDPLILSEDFNTLLDLLDSSEQSIFITGRAGTGKSTLLQLFRKTTKKKVVVLAPTGVAALNVSGQTIHSFFGFAPRLLNSSDIQKSKNPKFYKSIDVIVIDEISMVRADLLDNIDYALRLNREDQRSFGGIQMVFIGDLFQLPPVIATPYEKLYFQSVYDTGYFFSGKVFERGFEMDFFELRKVYRQEERHFINILESIRSQDIDETLMEVLNERYLPLPLNPASFITLTTRNAVAARINQLQLNKIEGELFTYNALIKGQFHNKLYPTDLMLTLKEGAQVMFIKNDPLRRFVNGTIGKIKTLTKEKVWIEIDEFQKHQVIEIEKHEWEILRYKAGKRGAEIKTEIIGSFTQFPLKLAYAITVHKSQGKTFDKVIIDLTGGAFEHGQTYVALSRCRTLNGIVLKRPIAYKDILVDERIVQFHSTMLR